MTFLKTAGAFLVLLCWNVSCDGCSVEPLHCKFPFEYNGANYSECLVQVKDDLSEYDEESEEEKVCDTMAPFEGSLGVCNPSCESGLNALCKTEARKCMFPFVYQDKKYHSCVPIEDTGKSWCPTEIYENGTIKLNRIGICNPDECATENMGSPGSLTGKDTPKSITVNLTSADTYQVSGSLVFSQEDRTSDVHITGSIYGLKAGKHGFHVHEYGDIGNNCKNAGKHFNPNQSVHGGLDTENRHLGDFGNIEADEEVAVVDLFVKNISLYDGIYSILGKSIVVHEDEDDTTAEFDDTGKSGKRVACGLILEKRPWNKEVFIIVVSVIVIIILIVLLVAIICYCVSKKDTNGREKVPYDDPHGDFPNGGLSKKSPLYDELSIPFIDASPAPTPKTGRSTERLSFFNRTPSIGRSRGSLSMPPSYAPPPPPSTESSTTEISWKGNLNAKRAAKV